MKKIDRTEVGLHVWVDGPDVSPAYLGAVCAVSVDSAGDQMRPTRLVSVEPKWQGPTVRLKGDGEAMVCVDDWPWAEIGA